MTDDPKTKAAFAALDLELAAIYATYRPALVAGFAQFVLNQGSDARVPLELHGKPTSLKLAGLSWQAVGRRLYGDEFVAALKKAVEKRNEG